MTARLVYEAVLIEMNKVDAPSLLLEDFNYLFNKAINLYINKRYNIYDINQQTTDDIRVLKSTAILKPIRVMENDSAYGQALESGNVVALNSLYGATYEVNLPADYLHVLNCICVYKVNSTVKCYNAGSYQSFAAKRLTSDAWPIVVNNWYQRPSYKRPYYFIHNVNTSNDMTTKNSTLRNEYYGDSIPTNPYSAPTGTDDPSMFGKGMDYNATLWKEVNDIQALIDNTVGTNITVGDKTYEVTLNAANQLYYKDTENTYYAVLYINTDGDAAIEWTTDVTKATTSGSVLKILKEKEEGKFNSADAKTYTVETVTNFARTINLSNGLAVDVVEKPAGIRLGNTSPVRLEVRYGRDDSVFLLELIHVDYIKTPQYIRLTPELLDLTIDTSQIMEFPDYVCQEIINELVHIVMENASDPRLQTHVPVSQSIAQPAQQLAATPSA